MNKCTRRGETLCVWVQIYPILIVYIVCAWPAVIIIPSPKQGPLTISIGWEGHRVGGKGGGLPGGRGQGGRGKGKRAIVSETCGHLGGQGENEENTCSAEWPRIATGSVCHPPWCGPTSWFWVIKPRFCPWLYTSPEVDVDRKI